MPSLCSTFIEAPLSRFTMAWTIGSPSVRKPYRITARAISVA